jgi:hypothetical protein
LQKIAAGLRDALAYVEARDVRVTFMGYCGVPPCLMYPYERYSEVHRRAPTAYTGTRVKLDACKSCDYDPECPGLWRGYHAQHGDPGLHPIRRRGEAPTSGPTRRR